VTEAQFNAPDTDYSKIWRGPTGMRDKSQTYGSGTGAPRTYESTTLIRLSADSTEPSEAGIQGESYTLHLTIPRALSEPSGCA